MSTDSFGQYICNTDDTIELMYQGIELDSINLEKEIVQKYNQTLDELKISKKLSFINDYNSIEEFDQSNQQNWYIPTQYKNIDIDKHVNSLVVDNKEKDRVKLELELYKKFNLYPVLRYLIYLVDLMRENNIVWGVGRGSSVSSYVLFLIGVHKVNSIEFDLDINEFLR